MIFDAGWLKFLGNFWNGTAPSVVPFLLLEPAQGQI